MCGFSTEKNEEAALNIFLNRWCLRGTMQGRVKFILRARDGGSTRSTEAAV